MHKGESDYHGDHLLLIGLLIYALYEFRKAEKIQKSLREDDQIVEKVTEIALAIVREEQSDDSGRLSTDSQHGSLHPI